MQTIWGGFTNQVICRVKLFECPFMLLGQLLQALCFSQRALDAIHTPQGVVLRLVEHLVVLENGQQALLPVQDLPGMKQGAQLVDLDIRLLALLPQQLRALGGSRGQSLDPIGRRRHGKSEQARRSWMTGRSRERRAGKKYDGELRNDDFNRPRLAACGNSRGPG